MKKLNFFGEMCLTLGIIFILPAGSGSQEAQRPQLEILIEEALGNNPQIQAEYFKWKASEYKIKQAKSLVDPMASVTLPGEHIQTRLGPQERKYGISQKIPFPGKLNLKGRIQDRQARMTREQFEAVKREIIKNVKMVYYDLYWIDRSIDVTLEQKDLLENLERVARRKYEANLAHQQDVLKAQLELSRLEDKLYILRQQRRSLEARLNSLLNRKNSVPVGRVIDVEPMAFTYPLEDLTAAAGEWKQELKAADFAVEKAKFEKSLAKMDYLPDFTFGFEYVEIGGGETTMPDDGQDAWMGMVSVNLPIWFDRLNAQVQEKKANIEAAQKNLDNVGNNVIFEVQDMYFKIQAYGDIVTLYETTLIPQARQAFDAARVAYESGKVDFLNWLDAENRLLQTELAFYKSVADYNKSIAFLERIVGKDL